MNNFMMIKIPSVEIFIGRLFHLLSQKKKCVSNSLVDKVMNVYLLIFY